MTFIYDFYISISAHDQAENESEISFSISVLTPLISMIKISGGRTLRPFLAKQSLLCSLYDAILGCYFTSEH